MFVDVKELKSGGVQRFERELRESLIRPEGQLPLVESDQGATAIPRVLEQVHLRARSGDDDDTSGLTPLPHQIFPSHTHRNIGLAGDPSQNYMAINRRPEPRFLLLCVNTRTSTTLLHIDLMNIQNDQYLFDGIRQRYWETRQNNSWHYGLLTPRWLASRIPTLWRERLNSLHLKVPHSAELIEVCSCLTLLGISSFAS